MFLSFKFYFPAGIPQEKNKESRFPKLYPQAMLLSCRYIQIHLKSSFDINSIFIISVFVKYNFSRPQKAPRFIYYAQNIITRCLSSKYM